MPVPPVLLSLTTKRLVRCPGSITSNASAATGSALLLLILRPIPVPIAVLVPTRRILSDIRIFTVQIDTRHTLPWRRLVCRRIVVSSVTPRDTHRGRALRRRVGVVPTHSIVFVAVPSPPAVEGRALVIVGECVRVALLTRLLGRASAAANTAGVAQLTNKGKGEEDKECAEDYSEDQPGWRGEEGQRTQVSITSLDRGLPRKLTRQSPRSSPSSTATRSTFPPAPPS